MTRYTSAPTRTRGSRQNTAMPTAQPSAGNTVMGSNGIDPTPGKSTPVTARLPTTSRATATWWRTGARSDQQPRHHRHREEQTGKRAGQAGEHRERTGRPGPRPRGALLHDREAPEPGREADSESDPSVDEVRRIRDQEGDHPGRRSQRATQQPRHRSSRGDCGERAGQRRRQHRHHHRAERAVGRQVQAAEPALPPDGQADPVHQLRPGNLRGQVGNPRWREQIDGEHGREGESHSDIPAAKPGRREVELECAHGLMLCLAAASSQRGCPTPSAGLTITNPPG